MPFKDNSAMNQKLEFVRLATAEGANVSALCRRFGIGRTSAHKLGMPAAMPVFYREKLVRPWLSIAMISPSISAEPFVRARSCGRMTLNWRVQS